MAPLIPLLIIGVVLAFAWWTVRVKRGAQPTGTERQKMSIHRMELMFKRNDLNAQAADSLRRLVSRYGNEMPMWTEARLVIEALDNLERS